MSNVKELIRRTDLVLAVEPAKKGGQRIIPIMPRTKDTGFVRSMVEAPVAVAETYANQARETRDHRRLFRGDGSGGKTLSHVKGNGEVIAQAAVLKKQMAKSVPEQIQALVRKDMELTGAIAKKTAKLNTLRSKAEVREMVSSINGLIRLRKVNRMRTRVMIDHCNEKGFVLAG